MDIICPKCGAKAHKDGRDIRNGVQKYKCRACKYNFRETTLQNLTKPNMGISLEEFKNKYDPVTQVREAVKKLEKGTLYKRQEFVQKFGIKAVGGYREVLNNDEFEQYRGNVNNEIQYFGHPEDIKRLKDEMLLK